MKANHTSIETLTPENELLASVVRCCSDAIITTSEDGLIKTWNPGAESLFGYAAIDAIGKHISVLIPAENNNEAVRIMKELLDDKCVGHFVTDLIKKDGALVKVSVSLSVVKSESSSVGIACIIRHTFSTCKSMPTDVEEVNEMLEQKVAERTFELKEANKALEAFSYSVSHDLKAPVRAIYSFAKIIHRDHKGQLSAEVLDLLTHIEGNSRRMSHIIEDLLALAKYSRSEPDLAPINMSNLFATVWENLRRSTNHNTLLTLHDLPVVNGDASMVEQVVVNLLSNAVKYSAKSDAPAVEVGAKLLDGKVTFFIHDNGAGFDMQYYHRLFGVFERLHNMNDFEGTGIGLFLVKRIVEKHGGTVWAQAKVNEGATFYFTLSQKQ
jgi:PAS domain S-box-containing protein